MPAYPLLDHLIGPLQERLRDRQAEGLGGLEVDDQFKVRRLFDWYVGRLGTSEDLVHHDGRPAEEIFETRAVGHQPPTLDEALVPINRRNSRPGGQPSNPLALIEEHRIVKHEHTTDTPLRDL